MTIEDKNQNACAGCEHRAKPCAGLCSCNASGHLVSLHVAGLQCPKGKHTHPPDWKDEPAEVIQKRIAPRRVVPRFSENPFHVLWREIHQRPSLYRDAASELAWWQKLIGRLPCGTCRHHAKSRLESHPLDFSSPFAYHASLTSFHNSVNVLPKVNKPLLSTARAARVHGLHALVMPEELAGDTTPIRLLIKIGWSMGDEVVATAVIEALHKSYPGEYSVSLDCKYPEVFANIDVSTTPDPAPEIVHVFKIHRDLSANRHFIDGAISHLEETIGRPLKRGPLKPHLVLSEAEWEAPPMVEGMYWVMAAGYKVDATTKAVPQETWQGVVDHYRGKIQFVQVGGVGAEHIEQHLDGTVDLTGKTTIRELFQLIASPMCLGVVSGITGVMHVGRAFDKPLVVVAGGREFDHVARYDNSEWLRTSPPCQNCWALRAQPWVKMGIPGDDPYPGHDDAPCVKPAGQFASCVTSITPARIAQGIARFAGRGVMGVCTYHDAGFAPWGAEAAATIQSYADRHGYNFIRQPHAYPSGDTKHPARWQKAEILYRELIHYEYLCWIDGDVVIIHPEFDLLAYIQSLPTADLYVNYDVNGLCDGICIFRNTLASHRFIRKWRASAVPGLCDQRSMVALLKDERDLVVYDVPQRKINAFMNQESDWLIHFGGPKKQFQHIRAFLIEYANLDAPRLPQKEGAKRAILVLGTESTGGKLWMDHLLACGCDGNSSHSQPFDGSIDSGPLIAWRKSFPCGDHFPDTAQMIERLKSAGYKDVLCYWTMRDRECSIRSMINARHAKTREEAIRDIEEGLLRVGKFVRDADLPCRIVRYERLIAEPSYRLELLKSFGLAPVGSLPEIYDGNARWLTATTSTTQLVRAEQIDIPKMSNRLG